MSEIRKVLPLKEAYAFGEQYDLAKEIAEIRDLEIEWDLSYTSSLRRGYIIALFKKHNLLDQFIEQYWPVGKQPWGSQKTNFWFNLVDRYKDFLSGKGVDLELDEDEIESEQAFAAESDLRDFLANNLDCVEPGLTLYAKDDQKGIEFPVDDGRIDILAIDKNAKHIVFELKLARGRNKALGQLLYYMAWVDKHLGNAPCRGIIVAKEISDDLILAVNRVQGVSLFKYSLSVSVERVK